MKQNMLQNVIGFILKYIWILCGFLIALELISAIYTTGVLMQQTSLGVMQSASGAITGKVDGVLRLLMGMAEDNRFADTSKPLFDRAVQARPYQESYNLYMIALTDKDVNVVSANEKDPQSENTSLAYRDYMQRLYTTGKYQITNAFLSGDGHDIMNYTIAVPIIKNDTVEGSIFGSIRFSDIDIMLSQQSQGKGRSFYLLGMDNTIMTGKNKALNGKSFLDLSEGSRFWGSDAESANRSMKAGKSGDYWEWNKQGLHYVTYQRVAPTNWSILYRVAFMPMLAKLIPSLCIKVCLYISMFAAISVLGRRYLNRHLAKVNHLLNRMAVMQKELFQSEQPDYDNLLDITQQGLTDHLTGLSTRTMLLEKMMKLTENSDFHGVLVFIDLDDLKRINDNFGHESGDCALLHFAKVLKEYEERYSGIAARYGGDEFVFICGSNDAKSASGITRDLCTALNTTIVTKEHTFSIHGSLGISFFPEHGTKLEELICKADLALYAAKQNGKNQCAFYGDID